MALWIEKHNPLLPELPRSVSVKLIAHSDSYVVQALRGRRARPYTHLRYIYIARSLQRHVENTACPTNMGINSHRDGEALLRCVRTHLSLRAYTLHGSLCTQAVPPIFT